jgi:ABC-type molybdate transport system substrate-binding protein
MDHILAVVRYLRLPPLRRIGEKIAMLAARAALNLVSRGEARFGIVYATDAKADPKVKVVGIFPESSYSPIVYPVALIAASANPNAAFSLAYLTVQAATKILSRRVSMSCRSDLRPFQKPVVSQFKGISPVVGDCKYL